MLQTLLSWAMLVPRHLRLWSGLARPGAPAIAALPFALVAVATPAFFFLYGLDAFPLRDNNEGLYAEIAREMLAGGDWIIPHLNGLPYIEKPPLLYWLTAASMAWFGATPGGARMVSALALLALSLGLFAFARRHLGLRAACFASTIFASMLPVALMAHLVLFDPLLCALLAASLLCFLHAGLAGSLAAQRLAACLMALAVLEKGAIALVLALGSWGMFLLLARGRTGARWRPAPGTLALFLVVAVPWHVLAALRQPGFAWFYLVNEHLLRFLGRRQPDDYHHGPLWFYVPRLLVMLLPWTPFLALGIRPRAPACTRTLLLRFCQAATLFPLAFFSLSQAKADYYLLVSAPFLALWLALVVDDTLQAGPARRLSWCWGAAAACCVVAQLAWPADGARAWPPVRLTLLLLGWLILSVTGARFFSGFTRVRARESAMLAIAALAAPLVVQAVHHAQARTPVDSSWQIANLIRAEAGPDAAVFLYRDFEDRFSTLPFYLGRPLPVIDSVSRDLEFGCRSAAGSQCIGHEAFLRQNRDRPVAVAVNAARREDFLAMAGPGWRSMAVGQRVVFLRAGRALNAVRPGRD